MWKLIQDNRELTILIAIGLLFTLLGFVGAGFHLQTLMMIFNSAQIVILLAIGATFVILTRNIDVSVGSTMGLSAVIVGSLLNAGLGLASAFYPHFTLRFNRRITEWRISYALTNPCYCGNLGNIRFI